MRARIKAGALTAWRSAPLASLRQKIQIDWQRLGFVGGCVRDWALNVKGKDMDLVWAGDFAELRQAVESAQISARIRPQYLTLTCHAGGHNIDIAATRQDRYPKPGGLPEIAAASLGADFHRRDFTANAMAVFVQDDLVTLHDPTEGLADMAQARLQPIASETLLEDPVRIVRGARYAARFGWQITASWQAALAAATAPEFWQSVAPGRIWRELQLLSDETAAVMAFSLLSSWKIDHALFGVSLQAGEFAALAAWRSHGQLEKSGTGKNWLVDLAILNLRQPELFRHAETAWQSPDSELQRFRKLWRKLERGLPDPLVDKIAGFRLK